MSLTNFGQQFANKTVRKFYQTAVTPAITNTNYEGQIRMAGDRLNLLSFLSDITMSDYVAGTDMPVESPVDAQDQLVVEKRKSFNFVIDRLEDLFTYADDVGDTLVENAAKVMERIIDSYVLQNVSNVKAGQWIGIPLRVLGSGESTAATITTSATGGTIQIGMNTVNGDGTVENGDGTSLYGGFEAGDVGRPVRLTSGTTWATEWYTIATVTSSTVATITNWDGAVSGGDIPNGDILRGLAGGLDFTDQLNGDDKSVLRANTGWGWEIQAAIPTTLTSSNVYGAITDMAEKLNNAEVPDTDRHLTVNPYGYKVLEQASQLTPAVAMAYDPIVINGKVGRVLGFDIHVAAGTRVSSRVGKSTAAGQGADAVLTVGSTGLQILGNHISFCTFAYKWAESRIVDAESQFAKKYQGLHLFGAKVPALRKKAGVMLYATSG